MLTVSASALGGYNDRLSAEEALLVPSAGSTQGGYTGFADAGLRFWRGRPARSFSFDGSGYMLSYSDLKISSPIGAQIQLGGETTLGRSARVEVTQQVGTDPYVAFGAFGPLQSDLGPGVGPDANPANGLAPERSWRSLTSTSMDWDWTRRTTLSAGYNYFHSEYLGDTGFDNQAHSARLALARSLTRTLSARASYRYGDTTLTDTTRDERWPVEEHTGAFSLSYAKNLSPTRSVEFDFGAGATHVQTVSLLGSRQLEYWAPSGHASARADIGRTWAISAAYRRGVTFLDGLTPESYLADVVLIRTEGTMSRRIELMFSSGYSNGKQPQTELLSGRYETFTLTAQARFVLARPWAVVVNYNRSDHRFFGLSALSNGLRSRYDQNAVRVGMAYTFTQSGTRAGRPTRPGRTEN